MERKTKILLAATASALLATAAPAFARNCVHGTILVPTAYGIDICVDPRFAGRFQSFFQSLKDSGARVTEIICQAYGHAPGSNHIGGGACDVNQRARNRTIPAMYHAGALIRAAGLYDGCSFHDCGHVEAMRGLGNYGERTLSARSRHHQRNPRTQFASVDSYMNHQGAAQ